MKNFGSIEDFYRSGKKDMKYLSEKERVTLDTIPDKAIITINKFDLCNSKNQTPHAGYNELEVWVPIRSRHMEKTLLYALTLSLIHI